VEQIVSRRSPYSLLAAITVPNYNKAMQTAARNQTKVNQALIVCGLERYRLAHGQYPEKLAMLTPEFIAMIPRDVIGGRPLKYRRTDDGRFLLYSIGWEEKDDGGVEWPSNKAGNRDWVWQYPAK
jgi:type II secretory pathway pseudopilin PulG